MRSCFDKARGRPWTGWRKHTAKRAQSSGLKRASRRIVASIIFTSDFGRSGLGNVREVDSVLLATNYKEVITRKRLLLGVRLAVITELNAESRHQGVDWAGLGR